MQRHNFHGHNLFVKSLINFRVINDSNQHLTSNFKKENTLKKDESSSCSEDLSELESVCERKNRGRQLCPKIATSTSNKDAYHEFQKKNGRTQILGTFPTSSKCDVSANALNMDCHSQIKNMPLKLPCVEKDRTPLVMSMSNKSQNKSEKMLAVETKHKKSIAQTHSPVPHHNHEKRVSLLPSDHHIKHHSHTKRSSLTPNTGEHHGHPRKISGGHEPGAANMSAFKDDPVEHVFRTKSILLLNDEHPISSSGKVSFSETDTTASSRKKSHTKSETSFKRTDQIKHVGHRLFSIMSQQQSSLQDKRKGRRESIYSQHTTRVMRMLQAFLDEYMQESGFTQRKELVVTPSMRFHLFRYLAREDHDPDDCFAADRELPNACLYSNEERSVKATFPRAEKTTGLSQEAVIFNTREEVTSNKMAKRLREYVKYKRDEWYEVYEGRKAPRRKKGRR